MMDWMAWLVLAGILVTLELFSGTFYLLMLALGLVAGAIAALAGTSVELQIILAAIVGMIATTLLHRSRFGFQGRKGAQSDAQRDPNVNLDIGQTVDIAIWQQAPSPGERPKARVSYRGAPWDVELGETPGQSTEQVMATPAPGRYRIVAIEGSRLIVAAGH